VLVGFLATAYVTLIIVGVYYCLDLLDDEYTNTIDKGVLGTIWRKAASRPAKTWEPVLRTAVLMYSDQQLVTGLAILASGYAQLSCGLSKSHWQIIVYLAWHSSLTHLATLTFLRRYFQENARARIWRSVLMLLLAVMLGVALLPTGDRNWRSAFFYDWNGDTSVLCDFRRLVAQDENDRFELDLANTPTMLVSILVLVSSYMTRLIKLSDRSTAFVRTWLRIKPGNRIKETLRDAADRAKKPDAVKYWRMKHFAVETAYVLLHAYFEILGSILWELLWLMLALAWGTHNLLTMTLSVGDKTKLIKWDFGQLLPVILLALPIFSLAQGFY
ncbi:MAG: hypothetical protein Q9174_005367, partial [Haloplaca sp. 1 TL-2023]